MASATRAQKLRERVARSAQDDPMEAATAKRMLEATPEGNLDRIAADIKAEWGKGIESQFAIGRKLMEARAEFDRPGKATGIGKESADALFGQWFRAQEFPFGRQTAWELRVAAEKEDEVRAFLTAVASSDTRKREGDISIATAIKMMRSPATPVAIDPNAGDTSEVNQSYAALRKAYNFILDPDAEGEPQANGFVGMHVEDLAKSAALIQGLANAYAVAREKVDR